MMHPMSRQSSSSAAAAVIGRRTGAVQSPHLRGRQATRNPSTATKARIMPPWKSEPGMGTSSATSI